MEIIFLNLKENIFRMSCHKGNMDTQYIKARIFWLDFSATLSKSLCYQESYGGVIMAVLIKDQGDNIE